MKKLLILFVIFFFSTNIFAAKYWNGQIKDINSPELKNVLNESLIASKNKNYKKSNDFIEKALKMKSAPEFLPENNDSYFGPLRLQLLVQRDCNLSLISLSTSPPKINPEVEKHCYDALKEYKDTAKGKKWVAYKNLYHRLVQYYWMTKKNKKRNEILDKLIEYDKDDLLGVLILGLEFDLSPEKSNDFINDYVKRTGKYDSRIMFYKIRYKDRSGKNVFYDCIDLLDEYPTMLPDELRTTIKLIGKNIDVSNPKQVKKYCDTIDRIILVQPNSADRLSLVSELIDEKDRMEKISN